MEVKIKFYEMPSYFIHWKTKGNTKKVVCTKECPICKSIRQQKRKQFLKRLFKRR